MPAHMPTYPTIPLLYVCGAPGRGISTGDYRRQKLLKKHNPLIPSIPSNISNPNKCTVVERRKMEKTARNKRSLHTEDASPDRDHEPKTSRTGTNTEPNRTNTRTENSTPANNSTNVQDEQPNNVNIPPNAQPNQQQAQQGLHQGAPQLAVSSLGYCPSRW